MKILQKLDIIKLVECSYIFKLFHLYIEIDRKINEMNLNKYIKIIY